MQSKQKGFTLLELLVVIAILAVLSAVTVVVLNPAELLRRSRDSQRINDLAAIKSALGFYMVEYSNPDLDGASGPTCADSPSISQVNVSLTANWDTGLAAGATSSTPGALDGTGWIPVDLTVLTGTGAPLPAYPVDPTNTYNGDTVGLYYAYACDSSPLAFEVTANFESSTNDALAANDGGVSSTIYETGTKANLIPVSTINDLYDGAI